MYVSVILLCLAAVSHGFTLGSDWLGLSYSSSSKFNCLTFHIGVLSDTIYDEVNEVTKVGDDAELDFVPLALTHGGKKIKTGKGKLTGLDTSQTDGKNSVTLCNFLSLEMSIMMTFNFRFSDLKIVYPSLKYGSETGNVTIEIKDNSFTVEALIENLLTDCSSTLTQLKMTKCSDIVIHSNIPELRQQDAASLFEKSIFKTFNDLMGFYKSYLNQFEAQRLCEKISRKRSQRSSETLTAISSSLFDIGKAVTNEVITKVSEGVEEQLKEGGGSPPDLFWLFG